jgi:hypothetical protein
MLTGKGGAIKDGSDQLHGSIVHVVCHGDMLKDKNGALPVLHAAREPLHANRFAAAIPGGCSLVFINSCYSAQQADSPFYSLNDFPRRLFDQDDRGLERARYVICNAVAVSDGLAASFASTFYQGLANGRSLLEAVWDARQSIRSPTERRPAWSFPVVYVNRSLDFSLDNPPITPEVRAPAPRPRAVSRLKASQERCKVLMEVLQGSRGTKQAYKEYFRERYDDCNRRALTIERESEPTLSKAAAMLQGQVQRLSRKIVRCIAQEVGFLEELCRGLAGGFFGAVSGILLIWAIAFVILLAKGEPLRDDNAVDLRPLAAREIRGVQGVTAPTVTSEALRKATTGFGQLVGQRQLLAVLTSLTLCALFGLCVGAGRYIGATRLRGSSLSLHVLGAVAAGVLLGLGCTVLYTYIRQIVNNGTLTLAINPEDLRTEQYWRPMLYAALLWGGVAWAAVGLSRPSLFRCVTRCLFVGLLIGSVVFVSDAVGGSGWIDSVPVRGLSRGCVCGSMTATLSFLLSLF